MYLLGHDRKWPDRLLPTRAADGLRDGSTSKEKSIQSGGRIEDFGMRCLAGYGNKQVVRGIP